MYNTYFPLKIEAKMILLYVRKIYICAQTPPPLATYVYVYAPFHHIIFKITKKYF